MNGNIVLGEDFLGCLNYVLTKKGARVITTNMAGETVGELAAEFRLVAAASRRIKKPVMHLSLSPHPDDRLDDSQKLELCQKLFSALGMSECQWVIAEHNDTVTSDRKERPHLHVVLNRIPINSNKAVNSSWIKRRTEVALQKLRKEFGLKPVVSSWSKERNAPSTSQISYALPTILRSKTRRDFQSHLARDLVRGDNSAN